MLVDVTLVPVSLWGTGMHNALVAGPSSLKYKQTNKLTILDVLGKDVLTH